jgi:hypothetical protein
LAISEGSPCLLKGMVGMICSTAFQSVSGEPCIVKDIGFDMSRTYPFTLIPRSVSSTANVLIKTEQQILQQNILKNYA